MMKKILLVLALALGSEFAIASEPPRETKKICVDVIMDYAEFAKTYNYYTKKLSFGGTTRSSSLSAYMSRDEESWSGPTEDDVYQEIRAIREEIERTMDSYYRNLPPEYQATYVTSWGETELRAPVISEYVDID